MIVVQSQVNPGNIEFYRDAELIQVPLGEYSQAQLENRKTALESELALVNEMLTHFSA